MNFKYTIKRKKIELDEYIGNEKTVNIPEEYNGYPITKIKPLCFFEKDVEEIYAPHIIEIENNSIIDCPKLRKVELNKAKKIGNIFEDCPDNIQILTKNLKAAEKNSNNVILTDDSLYTYEIISEIDKTAIITHCKKYYKNMKIPDFIDGYKIILIDTDVFYKRELIKKIELPFYLEKINNYQFAYCSDLREVIVKDNCLSFEDEAFKNSGLIKINCPENLKYIGRYCFHRSNLLSFKTNKNLIKISENAFSWIENEFVFEFSPDIVSLSIDLDKYIFYGTNIKSIYFPKYITKVPYGMFNYSHLELFGSEKTITELDDLAFGLCSNLYISANFIKNLRSIGCNSLSHVILDDSIVINKNTILKNDSFNSTRNLKKVRFQNNFCMNFIPEKCFYFSDVEEVILSNNIIELKDSCFSSSKIKKINTKNIKKIGDSCFCFTPNLEKFKFSQTLSVLGESVFYKSGIKTFTFDENLNISKFPKYLFSESQLNGKIKIPKEITTIELECFKYTEITNIDFNPSLKIIEDYAFYGTELIKLKFNEELESIGDSCFEKCYNLTEVSCNFLLKNIGKLAFKNCKRLNNINLENCLISKINAETFKNTDIHEIICPETLNLIDEFAFQNNKNITRLIFNKNIEKIGKSSFNCCKIENILFETSNKSLKLSDSAFLGTILPDFTIPENVVFIGKNCFDDLKNDSNFNIKLNCKNAKIEIHNFENPFCSLIIEDKRTKQKLYSRKYFK